jgi:heavy metal translocating P-type ATPase
MRGEPGDRKLGQTAFRVGLAVFFSMNVMVFTMALWSWDAYAISQDPRSAIFKELLRFGCLLFATPVLVMLGQPLVHSLLDQFRQRILSADGLLLVGVLAAYGYSVLSLLTGGEHVYLEVVCMILLAVTLGRWLEATGKHRAMKSLETLQDMLPDSAWIVSADGTRQVDLDAVVCGQVMRVFPGQRVPLDGTVVTGTSYVDERWVTGESAARSVGVGDSVFGGAVNVDGCLEIEVVSPLDVGVIRRLILLVREAASRPGRVDRLVDRVSTVFAAVIAVLAVAVFAFHWQQSGFHMALMASMSVVLIACPCALAIATPLAVWAAIGQSASRGIVFRSSDDLLRLAKIDHVCFDKTGTLTTDTPQLKTTDWTPGDAELGLSLTRLMATRTRHPLATAVQSGLAEDAMAGETKRFDSTMISCRTIPGCGVLGEVEILEDGPATKVRRRTVAMGSRAFCLQQGMKLSPEWESAKHGGDDDGLSTMLIGWDENVRGCFTFAEETRAGAAEAIQLFRSQEVAVELLSGDHAGRVEEIGRNLQIEVSSERTPASKLERIQELQSKGRTVVMVGDGVNDAPALSAADVGIAMGCGAEVSRDAADVCLMSSNLLLLPWAVRMARDTHRTIRRNLVWAMGYNALGVAIATTGRLNPIVAAIAMVLSSVFVITESLRLASRNSAEWHQSTSAGLASRCSNPSVDRRPPLIETGVADSTAATASFPLP